MSQHCPACGSNRLVHETELRRYAPPYGPPTEYRVPMVACRACGEGFEDEGASATAREQVAIADRASAKTMIEELESRRITMAYMERVLGLAPRTMARWKGGDLSAAALALLRIIRTFPWILRVARARFDQDTAKAVLSSEAFNTKTSSNVSNVVFPRPSGGDRAPLRPTPRMAPERSDQRLDGALNVIAAAA